MKPPALVLVNPAAHGGQAKVRFEGIRRVVEDVCTPSVIDLDPSAEWKAQVGAALRAGTRFFVAAGGDGTVHALVNALDAQRERVPLESLRLGAVGLGSSNDFHKPVAREIGGVPLRLDVSGARPRDLIDCRWESGRALVVVSASIGITAAANAFFNDGGPLLECLKRRHTGLAIPWAAARTIARFRPLVGSIMVDGRERTYRINNLSVLKTEWLSGVLHFDTPMDPADGSLAVHLLEGRSKAGSLRALVSLARGRFSHLPGTHSRRARFVRVALEVPADLELDGEVTRARVVSFEALPGRILACA